MPQLRRIFTLRDAPSGEHVAIPRALDLPGGAAVAETLVVDSRAAARRSQGEAGARVSASAPAPARAGLPRRASSMSAAAASAAPPLAFGRRLRSHSTTAGGALASPPSAGALRPGSTGSAASRASAGLSGHGQGLRRAAAEGADGADGGRANVASLSYTPCERVRGPGVGVL